MVLFDEIEEDKIVKNNFNLKKFTQIPHLLV